MNQNWVLVGDLNARCGTLGGKDQSTDGEKRPRNTKDKEINEEGKKWIDLMDEFGLTIMNGNIDGDWQGEITHVDYKSQSVIDYAAANDRAWTNIDSLKIEPNSASDHFPLEINLRHRVQATKKEYKWIQKWNEEGKNEYKTALSKSQEQTLLNWEDIHNKLWNATPKRRVTNAIRNPSWWDKGCYEKRIRVKTAIARARVDSTAWNEYRQERKDYKKLVKEKKLSWSLKCNEELMKVKNINQAWEYIRKAKPKVKDNSKAPDPEQMTEHFKKLLDGRDSLSTTTERALCESVSDTLTNLNMNEFNVQLNKMKSKKAAGRDQLKAEALKFADENSKDQIRMLMEKCLNGNPIPETWRESNIWPIHKKGSKTVAENYRGISISNSIYKLYASILNCRLEEYIESENLIQDTQNGFRKQRSAIDNVYILNHCINKSIAQNKKLFAFFVDFKAAFDMVDRTRLYVEMERLRIPQYLITAIKEIYRVTPNDINGKTFYTERGLKQGCPMSPLLFAIYISDMERTLKNFQSGGIVVGRLKIFSLAFADDIVLLSERQDDLKEMMRALHRYASRKGLVVNTEKSQLMVFSKGGRKSKETWLYGGINISEVKTFKYLGFTFQSNGKFAEHMKTMIATGKRRVAETWSIGERKFADNFTIRKQMFRSLIVPAITYGAEITGWVEWEGLELTQRRYLRWTLGLEKGTKKCLLMDETKSMPLYIETGAKALRYEERIANSPCVTLRECLREIHNGEVNLWTNMRKKYFNRNGYSEMTTNTDFQYETQLWPKLRQRDIDCFQQLQFIRIQECDYKHIRTDRVPWYLQRGRNISMIARFRCGNEEWGRSEWRKDQNCRVCGTELETIHHMLSVCCPDERPWTRILDERGSGEDWMKRILERRMPTQ